MSKRYKSLIPLTHDHHHALAQARRLKAATDADAATARRTADDFVNFYLGRARQHFREEEELFFAPLVDDETVGPLIAQAVADHLRLHSKVRELRRQLSGIGVTDDMLRSIADLLEEHVRFEERELFPLIESSISESELAYLATIGHRYV